VQDDAGAAVVEVTDDGRGFDPAHRPSPGHFGLANLRDRAAALGGELRIDSQPGGGTSVTVRVPLSQQGAPG
jgi:signal transduction histidine kinase